MSVEIRQLKEHGQIFYPVTVGEGVIFNDGYNLEDKLDEKQDALVSGTNIKTIKGQSVLGSGNISVIDGNSIIYFNGTYTYTANSGNNLYNFVYSSSTFSSEPLGTPFVLMTFDVATNSPIVNDDIYTLKVFQINAVSFDIPTSITTYSGTLITSINLKGVTGDVGPAGITSVNAYVDNTSGTPAVSASVTNQVLTLMFSGLKGAQGASGYSGAANELQVVNNLTDGGTTAALSAEMGKTLKGMIPQWTTMTEEAYDLLVLNENTDDDVFYFLYEDE